MNVIVEPRELLQRRLALLQKRNGAYSLRSFARDLGVSAAWLSAFLTGRKGMSPERAEALALALRLRGAERRGFLAATKAKYSRSRTQREQGRADLRKAPSPVRYDGLPREVWGIVSTWRSYALVEILKRDVDGRDEGTYVKLDMPRMASLLGLEPAAVRILVKDLVCSGLVEEQDGRFRPGLGNTYIPAVPEGHASLRAFHTGLLERAFEGLRTLPAAERRAWGLVVAASESSLALIQERMSAFLCSLDAELEATCCRRDRIYGVALHAFPLTGDLDTR